MLVYINIYKLIFYFNLMFYHDRGIKGNRAKKIVNALRSSSSYTVVTYGKKGECYVLRGRVERPLFGAILDEEQNFARILARITTRYIEHVNVLQGRSDAIAEANDRPNRDARMALDRFIEGVLKPASQEKPKA